MPSTPYSLACNEEKNHLAIGLGNGVINIRQAETGEYVSTKSVEKEYESSSVRIKYTKDNETLFYADRSNGKPHLFDAENNYQEIALEENDYSSSWQAFDFHPTRPYVAVIDNYGYLKVYDTETKALVAEEEANYYYDFQNMIFSNDGKRLMANGSIYDTSILFNELTGIKATPSTLYMNVDDTEGTTVYGSYSNGSQKAVPSSEVKWTTNNPSVVTFMYGKFQALKSGTATVTASYKGFTTTATIRVSTQQFTDLRPIHVNAVNYLVGKQIAGGLSKTTFGTNATIKRVDAAIMIAKALELNTASAPKAGFKDVPARGQAYVNALKANGIIGGKSKTTFGTDDQITRGEMALILQRAYKLTPGSTQHPFYDGGSRYDNALSSLVRYKIITGISSYEYGISLPITRGDFAIFLYNAEMVQK